MLGGITDLQTRGMLDFKNMLPNIKIFNILFVSYTRLDIYIIKNVDVITVFENDRFLIGGKLVYKNMAVPNL